jgi:CBS domain-containing protein
VGWLWRQDLGRGPVGPERASSPEPLLDPDSTLRDALSSMLGSAVQEGLVVDADGRLLGIVSIEAVGSILRREPAASSR